MEKIVRFIAGYKSYLTFLLCLLLSIMLLFSSSSMQVLTLRTILVNFSGTLTEPFRQFLTVFSALEENELLKAENMRLRHENSLFLQQQQQINQLKEILQLKSDSELEMKAGTIVAWGTVPIPNTITINLGTEDGISKNDPVISSDGLVGKVLSPGRSVSICQMLTDRNFKVSAIARETGAFGLLEWKSNDIAEMRIQKSAVVSVGDTIVTSEHGNIYPEGILIGTVDSFYDGPELFQIVNVKLFVDYLQLRDIAVIINNK